MCGKYSVYHNVHVHVCHVDVILYFRIYALLPFDRTHIDYCGALDIEYSLLCSLPAYIVLVCSVWIHSIVHFCYHQKSFTLNLR